MDKCCIEEEPGSGGTPTEQAPDPDQSATLSPETHVRLEAACRHALTFDDLKYCTVKTILENGIDLDVSDEPAFDRLAETYIERSKNSGQALQLARFGTHPRRLSFHPRERRGPILNTIAAYRRPFPTSSVSRTL